MYQILDQNMDSSDYNRDNTLIDNISIPYSAKLRQKLSVGSFIEIFAKTDENADRFAINLMTDSEDIALHFNPRIKEGCVARNTRVDNDWCNEEREPLSIPFKENQSFTLIISVDKEAYRLFVNGIHFTDFKHRMPYNSVTSFSIDGDLQVLWIKFDRLEEDNKWDAFSCSLSSTESPLQQLNEIQTFFDPTVPFSEDISSGLRVGMVLAIIGRPLSDSKRFDINLVQKEKPVRIPNIAFHMSVRFGDSMVVRNSRSEGEWGIEDRYSTEFPFFNEKIFDLRIIVERNRYIVIINGKNFCEFPNRLYPLSDTNQIEINGNIKLFSVRF